MCETTEMIERNPAAMRQLLALIRASRETARAQRSAMRSIDEVSRTLDEMEANIARRASDG